MPYQHAFWSKNTLKLLCEHGILLAWKPGGFVNFYDGSQAVRGIFQIASWPVVCGWDVTRSYNVMTGVTPVEFKTRHLVERILFGIAHPREGPCFSLLSATVTRYWRKPTVRGTSHWRPLPHRTAVPHRVEVATPTLSWRGAFRKYRTQRG